jgi:hypothetical protein
MIHVMTDPVRTPTEDTHAMTDQLTSNAASRGGAPRPSLYRYVVSLGIAAIVATWLPFSFLYINALSRSPAAISTQPLTHSSTPTHSGLAHVATLAPVTTRTS